MAKEAPWPASDSGIIAGHVIACDAKTWPNALRSQRLRMRTFPRRCPSQLQSCKRLHVCQGRWQEIMQKHYKFKEGPQMTMQPLPEEAEKEDRLELKIHSAFHCL